MERLGDRPDRTISTYLRSYEADPLRAEALCAAARLLNAQGLHSQAYEVATRAAAMPEPDVWTLDTAAYEWRALDQLLIATVGTFRFAEAVEIAERLLSEAKFPESERERIERNAAYALAQYDLAPAQAPATDSA